MLGYYLWGVNYISLNPSLSYDKLSPFFHIIAAIGVYDCYVEFTYLDSLLGGVNIEGLYFAGFHPCHLHLEVQLLLQNRLDALNARDQNLRYCI